MPDDALMQAFMELRQAIADEVPYRDGTRRIRSEASARRLHGAALSADLMLVTAGIHKPEFRPSPYEDGGPDGA